MMKLIPCLLSLGALAAPGTLFAQDRDAAVKPDSTIAVRHTTDAAVDAAFSAKDLLGSSVRDLAGERLGVIRDVLLDEAKSPRPDEAAVANAEEGKLPQHDFDQLHVVISVGGLFGMADDVVLVPAEALSYDRANDTYTLNVSKTEFVAIAKQSASGAQQPERMAAPGAASDVAVVTEALREDTTLRTVASDISVDLEDNQIVLSGVARNASEKDRIVEVAREATDKPVVDNIEVAMR